MTRRIVMAAAGLLIAAGVARAEASVSDTDAKQAAANKNPPARKRSYDPNAPLGELKSSVEDIRRIEAEWKRIWFAPENRHLTPERVHGGIQ
jgi:hypothetical protein